MSTVAVVLALGGTAYGVAGTIGSSGIIDSSIRSADIANDTIASVDIHNGAINKVDLAAPVAAGVGATPVAVHTEDVHPGDGYLLGGQDLATSTLKLPTGGPWLIDITADFTPTTSNTETVVGCVFLVDGQLWRLPFGEKTDRSSALRMSFHDARQVAPGTHTVAIRCTAADNVVVKEVDLTAIAFRLPKA
jgi:hypothetical protein